MGASDSKLVFKKGIFRLSEERHIPADDPYWTSFWVLPESSEDVFSLFTAADIRRTRDQAPENLETLILAVTSRLFVLRHHPSFPDPELAPERDALNCIRVLTRILPYIYEKESLEAWEARFFWGARRRRTRKARIANEVLFDEANDHNDGDGGDGTPRATEANQFEDAPPLAEELLDTLIDLLFLSDFTVSKQGQRTEKPKVTYAIWQSGVGCNQAMATTKEFESKRVEILRLLLTMTGQSMYVSASVLPQRGVRALNHLCGCSDKQIILSVLCSLLNTTMKYNPASWRVPYNTLVFKDAKEVLVTYSLQLLVVLLLYPMPERDGASQRNHYRHFMGRVHRPQDFQFIVDGMTRTLNQPLTATSSYIPGTQSSVPFAPEILMLFWEITQCNKRFRSFIIDTGRIHDFVVLILFYALEYKNDASKQGVVRMCAFLIQTLSVEPNFGPSLNKAFDAQETLPPAVRIPGFKGTYADFLLQSIYSLITTSHGKLVAIYPALLAIINNVAPSLEGLSQATCQNLIQFFNSMSAPSFLFANETNHDLLQSLLESMSSVLEHQYQKNPELVAAILKNRRRFEALRNFTLESGQEEIERRNRRKKDKNHTGEDLDLGSTRSSVDSSRSPLVGISRSSTLDSVPEDDNFAIGDDDEEEDDDEISGISNVNRPLNGTTHNDGQPQERHIEDAVPTQLRGMSEKARGKLPAGSQAFSRQSSITSLASAANALPAGTFEPSTHWLDSWLPELPLHTILSIIQQISALLPPSALQNPSHTSSSTLQTLRTSTPYGIDPSPIRIHSFVWSPLALGWYESLIWSSIFSGEMQIARGTVGVWNGTAIRLFRVQETAAAGPSLLAPRGAVDAVGSTLVSRIGNLNLKGPGI